MGTLFMVNPPKRKKAKKRRTAAQKRATEKMLAANRRKRGTKKRRRSTSKSTIRRKGTVTMARKRKRRATATPRRRTTTKRRRSTARRRSPVTRLRRNSVYLTNPRGRKRRRRSVARYRRNPSIIATLKQGAMDAGATLAGGAAARVVTGLLPLPKDGLAGVASGVAVALGVGYAARKVVSSDVARFVTAGAMQVPIKALITTFLPSAGAYLGDYDNMGAYAVAGGDGMGDYLNSGRGMYGSPADNEVVEVGVYE